MNLWLTLGKFCCRQLARADSTTRFRRLREVGRLLVPEYRFKWPQMDWWSDADFNDYLEKFGEMDGMNADRRWMLHELLQLVADIEGDTAECGVFSGSSSYLICAANAQSSSADKLHHMFDSFQGVSRPTSEDGDHWSEGDLAYDLPRTRENLAQFTATRFYPGWIPTRFEEVADRTFSFVHIDVDLYEPTRDSIAFFYPRLNPGGILVVDDYGFTSCPGATRAVDQYLADHREPMLRMSGGGGFLVKQVKSSAASVAA